MLGLYNRLTWFSVFSNPAIGSDGLCCQSREVKEWHGCRATKGLTKGTGSICTWADFRVHVLKHKLSLNSFTSRVWKDF